jgi:hypothetical protein
VVVPLKQIGSKVRAGEPVFSLSLLARTSTFIEWMNLKKKKNWKL